jgi:hypothetical protein
MPGARRDWGRKQVLCQHCNQGMTVRTLWIARVVTVLIWGDCTALILVSVGIYSRDPNNPVGAYVAFFLGVLTIFISSILVFGVSYGWSKWTHHDLPRDEGEGWWIYPRWPRG